MVSQFKLSLGFYIISGLQTNILSLWNIDPFLM